MTYVNTLWNSEKEDAWFSALDEYWRYVKPSHLAVEKEFDPLDTNAVQGMNPNEWYEFLLNKYFFWKYTAPNRYATTTAQLKKYKTSSYGLDELFLIKKRMFDFDKEDIASGLKIACSIKGLGTAGASGLLAMLFPAKFATVDQFAVKALSAIDNLPERIWISSMNPDQLKIKDAVILIEIMRNKAKDLNNKFSTSFWNPRRIDMILWVVQR
jgi:hypothetical protein